MHKPTLPYWKAVHRQAKDEALAGIGITTWERLVVGVIVTIAVILALLLWGSQGAGTDEFKVVVTTVVVLLVAFACFYFSKLLTIPARLDQQKHDTLNSLTAQTGPRLQLTFEPKGKGFIVQSPMAIMGKRFPSKWIRAKLVNSGVGTAPRCKVYLIDVHRLSPDQDDPIPTTYAERLLLNFSHVGPVVNVPTEVEHFVDVMSANALSKRMSLATNQLPMRLENLFQQSGIYRLAIQAIDEAGNKSDLLEIDVMWTGKWDDLSARLAAA